MAVISTPINGALRMTYMHNLADLRVNGILPTALPAQVADVADSIRSIQQAVLNDVFLIVESELTED